LAITLREQSRALDQGRLSQIETIQVEEIESVDHQLGRISAAEYLQRPFG
jgi:hypothetical protein